MLSQDCTEHFGVRKLCFREKMLVITDTGEFGTMTVMQPSIGLHQRVFYTPTTPNPLSPPNSL